MNRSKSLILSILLAALLVLTGLTSAAATKKAQVQGSIARPPQPNQVSNVEINQLPPMAPGVVLVGLKPGVTVSTSRLGVQASDASLDAAFANIGVQGIESVFPNAKRSLAAAATDNEIDLNHIYRLRLAPDADILRIVENLNANPAVAYAEPDYLAHIIATPNDPLYSGQWGLTQINAPAAWDVTTGTTDVVIAVVDAGLDTSHPDLAGQLWTNPGEIAGNSVDDDNNGYVDDIHGWNLVDDNANLSDNTGHGTEVAGVIAAATNNGQGVAGVCWNCRLMIVKVTQPGGVANYSDIAAGVAYAAQKGAEVINLSLGGYSDSATLRAAIEIASQTAVVVGGAGNDNKSDPFYPAAYDDYVLAVAGTTSSDTKVGTSNYGTWVDVSAPGEVITTTFSGGGYGPTSGTSMAAPFASGLAGLLRSLHPGWSADMVRAQIIHTTDDIDSLNPGYEGKLGSGRIDAGQAAATAPVPDVQFVNYAADGQMGGTLEAGAVVTLTVTLRNDWLDASTVVATLATTDTVVSVTKATAAFGAISAGETVINRVDPFQVSVTAGQYNHAIPFSLQVVSDGNVSVLVFTATTESAAVTVGGTLSSDTTWTNDRVYIANNVIVDTGVTLTIQPGTVVKFNLDRAMVVKGALIADGTPESPIRFTSAADDPAPGDWGGSYSGNEGGIIFASSSQPAQFDTNGGYQGGSIIRYAIVEYSKGLTLQDAAPFIDHNLIRQNSSSGGAVFYNGYGGTHQPIISHNRIISNTGVTALNVQQGQAIVRQNLIANNSTGLYVTDNQTVVSNTITDNGSTGCAPADGTICLAFTTSSTRLTGNNIYANHTTYDVAMRFDATQSVTATSNYWGTIDQATIQSRIYDSNQDLNVGTVNFIPFLTEPEPTAPPILYQLSLSPASPVGIQTVTFELAFSRPMDPSTNPIVTFGATVPYTSYTVVDNAQWITDKAWSATYDVTSLVPRGAYTISVSGARGATTMMSGTLALPLPGGGMEIPTDTRFGFTVDYAGEITDQTPPNPPLVIAGGEEGDASTVVVLWSASDPDSSITGYRYAIGSSAGATDIVNWTNTSSSSIIRSGLGLVEGRQYWLAVQARNEGGLWSASAYRAFIAGQPYPRVFLPLVSRNG